MDTAKSVVVEHTWNSDKSGVLAEERNYFKEIFFVSYYINNNSIVFNRKDAHGFPSVNKVFTQTEYSYLCYIFFVIC